MLRQVGAGIIAGCSEQVFDVLPFGHTFCFDGNLTCRQAKVLII
jgi:hypothetical protein